MSRTRNKTSLPKFSALPKTYKALCLLHMPRTIHDASELDSATEIIDLMAGHKLTKDQEDHLTTLADLTSAFKENHIDQSPKLKPRDFSEEKESSTPTTSARHLKDFTSKRPYLSENAADAMTVRAEIQKPTWSFLAKFKELADLVKSIKTL